MLYVSSSKLPAVLVCPDSAAAGNLLLQAQPASASAAPDAGSAQGCCCWSRCSAHSVPPLAMKAAKSPQAWEVLPLLDVPQDVHNRSVACELAMSMCSLGMAAALKDAAGSATRLQ